MNEDIKQLKDEVARLKTDIEQMKSSSTFPLAIDQAIRGRFPFGSTLATSSKSATSENQAVNEGGSATYSVLGIPDGFVQTTIGNSTIYIAYWT